MGIEIDDDYDERDLNELEKPRGGRISGMTALKPTGERGGRGDRDGGNRGSRGGRSRGGRGGNDRNRDREGTNEQEESKGPRQTRQARVRMVDNQEDFPEIM